MEVTILLEKLWAIERSLADGDDLPVIQAMVVEAGSCVLQLQRELADAQAEAELLRMYIRNAQQSSLLRLSTPCISEAEVSEMSLPSATAGPDGIPSLRRRFVN